MRPASPLLRKTVIVLVGCVAVGSSLAGTRGSAGDVRRPNNSFNLFVAPPPSASDAQVRAQGVGIASGKAVILDPYKVPLIQDAASLSPGR